MALRSACVVGLACLASLAAASPSTVFDSPAGMQVECDAAGRIAIKDGQACSYLWQAQECNTHAGYNLDFCVWLPCEYQDGLCKVSRQCNASYAAHKMDSVHPPGYITKDSLCKAKGEKVAEFGHTAIPHYFDVRYEGKIGAGIPDKEPVRALELKKYNKQLPTSKGCVDTLRIPYRSLIGKLSAEEKAKVTDAIAAPVETSFRTDVSCKFNLMPFSTRSYANCAVLGHQDTVCVENDPAYTRGVYELVSPSSDGSRSMCMTPATVNASESSAPLAGLYPLGSFAVRSLEDCKKQCDRVHGCNVFNYGNGHCYLDKCPASMTNFSQSGVKDGKGFEVFSKTSEIRVKERFVPKLKNFTAPKKQIEIARKHAEYGKTVKIQQAWPDRTVEELHRYMKHIDTQKMEAIERSLEGYRENEIKVKYSIEDADRLSRKVQVTEVITARKKAANMLKAQMEAPNKRAARKIAQKRLHVLGNVSHIESEFFNMDRPSPPPSTWYDINRRVSKIPLVIGKPLPSIKDGDNYNPKAYPVHVPWVDPVKSAEEEEEALENDLYAGLPKKLKPKKVVEKEEKKQKTEEQKEEQKIEKKSQLFNSPLSFFDKLQLKQKQKNERDAELEKYAALLKESEGPKKEQVTPFDESIPDPKQLPEAETEGEKSVVPPQPVEDAKVPTQN